MKRKNSFKDRLVEAMGIRNIRAIDLHEKTGLSKARISQYMTGTYEAKNDGLSLLADALNVSELWLMGYEVPMDPSILLNKGLNQKSETRKIPVLGKVAAGEPLHCHEDVSEYEEIPKAWAGEYFALKIKGASMEPKISENDIVIVRVQNDINSGDTAVVLVNNEEATVKKVIKSEQGITLVATNANVYIPHFYSNEDIEKKPVKILGKVVELRAKF